MATDVVQSDLISRVVPLFAEHLQSDDDTLLDAIIALGIDQRQAIAILDFMPIAFFHVAADGKIADMPDHYVRYCADETPIGNVRFMDEPIYVAARHYAETECETDGLDPVLRRSAEFNAMNNLLNKGTPMERVRLGPSVFMDYVTQNSSSCPWWQFWR